MEGTRVSKAVARIETALTRIERAAEAIPVSAPKNAKLANRNERLETTLREGLAELDTIIDRLQK